MKGKKGKRVLGLLLICVMVFTPVASQAATSKNFGVIYIREDPNDSTSPRTGIASVMIDDMNYYDLYGGADGSDRKTNTTSGTPFLADILESKYSERDDNGNPTGESLLQHWADLAYAVFDANGDYADIDGMSSFAPGVSDESGKSGDISYLLTVSRDDNPSNSEGKNATVASGLSVASSLDDVRNKAIHTIAEKIDLSNDGWIDDHNDSNDALSYFKGKDDLDNVLYSTVCFVHHSGYTWDYHLFGLVFYNFDLEVIANDQLSYITAAEGYSSLQDASAKNAPGVVYETNSNTSDVLSYYENGSREAADVGMEFSQSNSMAVSNTLESSQTYSFSSMIGSESKISSSITPLITVEETLKLEFTTGEAISTAYSDTNTITKTTESTVTADMNLPAQSAVAIASSSDEINIILDYDCPVAVTYNVGMFSMSGKIYHDWVTAGNPTVAYDNLYPHTNFTAMIGNSTSDAVSNLYNRTVVGINQNGYDEVNGDTLGRKNGTSSGSWSSKTSLDWNSILDGESVEVIVDTVPVYVEQYEVDANGKVGNLIDTYEYMDGYVGYDTEIGVMPTITNSDGTVTHNIYLGEVLENGVNVNAGLETNSANSSMYSRIIVPRHEDANADGNIIVKFYYTPVSNGLSTLSAEDIENTEEAEEPAIDDVEISADEQTEEFTETESQDSVTADSEEAVESTEAVTEEEVFVETEAEDAGFEESISEEVLTDPVEEIVEPAEAEAVVEVPADPVEEIAEPAEAEAAAEVPAESEETVEIAMYAETTADEEIAEAEEPAESEGAEVYAAPAASYEDEVIVGEGDLIGSISNGGTIAGMDSTGSYEPSEPSLVIESIEIVENEEIPEELQENETVTEESSIPVTASIRPLASYLEPAASVSWLIGNTPMSITGGSISTSGRSMSSEIYGIEPIYPLDKTAVTSSQKTFDMISGSSLNLDNIEVDGYNANDIAYYGFDQSKGYWIVTDADGNEISTAVASLGTDPATGETLLIAEEEGTVYLKYMIDEDSTKYSDMNGSDPVTNDDLSSAAMVKVNVAKGPFYGTVTAEGTLTGYANETDDDYERLYINLDTCDTIKATVYDETGKKISNPAITWEAQEDEEDGIILENDQLYFTKPGTYHIRAVYGYSTVNNNPYSEEWLEVTALPEKVLNELTIEDITDPATLRDITLGDGYETINLGWLDFSGADQYGIDWTKLENLKWYVDGKEVEPSDSGAYLYTATEAGTHTIYAQCADADGKYNVKSNELTLTVHPERELSSLAISDKTSPATLAEVTYGEGKENVDLSKLTITSLDQYGDEWSDLGNLEWYVDGQALTGSVYTVTNTCGGTHTIYAQCDGVKSNELNISVKVPATSVKINKDSLEILTGKTKQLTAAMKPAGTTDSLTWKSSDKKVVTVNENGEVTGVSAGTATITATATSGQKATCTVHVAYSKGETFSKGAYTYYVKDASTDGSGKVYMTGFAKGQSKKKVAVPDTVTVGGTTYKVTAIANEAFKDNSKITSFTSGANLTTIGKSAFEDCSKLKTVNIGNSVKKIEFKAFYDCYKLKTLSIGKNVNFMGAHCFCNDYKLQKITIKTTKLKAKNVESPHVFINVNKATMKVPKSQYQAYTKIFTAREYGGKITK